jgi:hypothetical protein
MVSGTGHVRLRRYGSLRATWRIVHEKYHDPYGSPEPSHQGEQEEIAWPLLPVDSTELSKEIFSISTIIFSQSTSTPSRITYSAVWT